MKQSISIKKLVSRTKSETIFKFESPKNKIIKKIKDPFSDLQAETYLKLQPTSPSCFKVPTTESKFFGSKKLPATCTERKIIKIKQFDLVFRPVKLKIMPKSLEIPKTPYFKLRRKELVENKEPLTTRNRYEFELDELSFGHN